ncbi:MAG: DUF4271 domain-containing protein [Muribaculaceae bacterium]|nr:DUF4271 domain-containing protein [Muribaculaceae bacterium]
MKTDSLQQTPLFNSAGLPVPPALPDSIPTDSIVEPVYGMVIESPVIRDEKPAQENPYDALSWVWLFLAALFCAVALKFKNNAHYIRAVVSDLTVVRVRHNAFDDTVRETSFLVLLNVLWIVSCGVLLWKVVMITTGNNPFGSFGIPDRPAEGIGICTLMVGIYDLVMFSAYWIIGFVFSDRDHARMWVKGAGASQGLEAMLLLPIAALTISYAPWSEILLEIAAGLFILGKIIFIYKGFRIFFTQISSWMLFLYYLCSVEIVPLILTYLATLQLCSVWL